MNDAAKLFENFSKAERNIAESYLQLISDENRSGKITVQKIIDQAGITRSTFYVYYDNVSGVQSAVLTEFERCAGRILSETGTEDSLLRVLTDWFRFCREHRAAYLALRELPGSGFADRIRQVWSEHIARMLIYDRAPEDGFRRLHELYAPYTNEFITYQWLKDPCTESLTPRDVAFIINNQRLHYVTTALARRTRETKYTAETEYMTSEVVSVNRIRELIETGKEAFIHQTFTEEEILQAEESYISLFYYAQFYAGKRAVARSILGYIDSTLFRDISVRMIRSNTPVQGETTNVVLTGRAKALAEEKNITRIRLTTSAEAEYVTAFVMSTL
ncbi:MAG: hypothetical protein IJH77_03940 [Mogibacterium sp.]|nr:hypothetical protein [Mogibacterium sp.]